MKKVSASEFRKNFSKYQKEVIDEDIEITVYGKTKFIFACKKKTLEERAKEFLGILPSNATCG
jgi:hypothetical protein